MTPSARTCSTSPAPPTASPPPVVPAAAPPRPPTPRPSLQWALAAITDGVAFVRDQQPGPARHQRAGPRLLLAADRRRRPHAEPRPVPVPRSGLARLLPRLGPVRRDVRRDHARRGRPRPPRQGTAGPRRRALHPQRHVPAAVGRPRRPHPRRRHEAVPPPRRRRAHARLRGTRHHRRTRPRAADLHRRARITVGRAPPAARLLGRRPPGRGPGE